MSEQRSVRLRRAAALLVLLIALADTALVFLGASRILTIPFGLALVCFLPGYAWLSAFRPRAPVPLQGLLLAVMGSLGTAAVVGVGLNELSSGISARGWAVSLTAVVIAGLGAGWFRGSYRVPDDAPAAPAGDDEAAGGEAQGDGAARETTAAEGEGAAEGDGAARETATAEGEGAAGARSRKEAKALKAAKAEKRAKAADSDHGAEATDSESPDPSADAAARSAQEPSQPGEQAPNGSALRVRPTSVLTALAVLGCVILAAVISLSSQHRVNNAEHFTSLGLADINSARPLVWVYNHGGVTTAYTLSVLRDGTVVGTQPVTVPSGRTVTRSLAPYLHNANRHTHVEVTLSVDNSSAAPLVDWFQAR